MKSALNTLGTASILAGLVFVLQGLNVLPGSFMTGDPQWAVNGAILIAVGIGLLAWSSRLK